MFMLTEGRGNEHQEIRQRLQLGPISGRFLAVVLSPFSTADGRGLVIGAHDNIQTVRYEELRKEFVANVFVPTG